MAHEEIIKEVKKAALKENIPPKETEHYFLKKGLDEKEAKRASEQIKAAQILESAKKAEKERKLSQEQKAGLQSANEKKSGFGLFIIILLATAVIVFLFYYGVIPASVFNIINFK